MRLFMLGVKLVRTVELMHRANRGATIWGSMRHAQAGNVPAYITKDGPNSWAVKLQIKGHPGFSWRLTDAQAFDWVHHNAR